MFSDSLKQCEFKIYEKIQIKKCAEVKRETSLVAGMTWVYDDPGGLLTASASHLDGASFWDNNSNGISWMFSQDEASSSRVWTQKNPKVLTLSDPFILTMMGTCPPHCRFLFVHSSFVLQ